MRRDRPIPRLIPMRAFVTRVAQSTALAGVLIVVSLGLGTLGYHGIEKLPWVDSILNASMIFAGMGPVDRMETVAGKLFASAYAVFCGIAFLSIVALMLAPAFHRFLHSFHLDLEEEDKRPEQSPRPSDQKR